MKDLKSAAVIVGVDEVVEVGGQLDMAVVLIALDGRLLDCLVHPLDQPYVPEADIIDGGMRLLVLLTMPVSSADPCFGGVASGEPLLRQVSQSQVAGGVWAAHQSRSGGCAGEGRKP